MGCSHCFPSFGRFARGLGLFWAKNWLFLAQNCADLGGHLPTWRPCPGPPPVNLPIVSCPERSFIKRLHAPQIGAYLHQILKDTFVDNNLFPIQVAGYDKLRLGFRDTETITLSANGLFVELRATGFLFKDRRTNEWFNGLTGSDIEESASSAL